MESFTNQNSIPFAVMQLLNLDKAYIVDDSVVFARHECLPCTAAPPRRYDCDVKAIHPNDYVLWSEKGGTTVNLSRMQRSRLNSDQNVSQFCEYHGSAHQV